MDDEDDAVYGALAAGIAFVVIVLLTAAIGWYLGAWD